jgi:hypothetical protein
MATREELINRFTYHPPKNDQPDRYVTIRKAGLEFALLILETTPESREQSVAFTKIDEAVQAANSAIARNE